LISGLVSDLALHLVLILRLILDVILDLILRPILDLILRPILDLILRPILRPMMLDLVFLRLVRDLVRMHVEATMAVVGGPAQATVDVDVPTLTHKLSRVCVSVVADASVVMVARVRMVASVLTVARVLIVACVVLVAGCNKNEKYYYCSTKIASTNHCK
jgi:hypothetical protein